MDGLAFIFGLHLKMAPGGGNYIDVLKIFFEKKAILARHSNEVVIRIYVL